MSGKKRVTWRNSVTGGPLGNVRYIEKIGTQRAVTADRANRMQSYLDKAKISNQAARTALEKAKRFSSTAKTLVDRFPRNAKKYADHANIQLEIVKKHTAARDRYRRKAAKLAVTSINFTKRR